VSLNRLIGGACFVLAVFASACDQRRPAIYLAGTTMGTQYSITIPNPGDLHSDALELEVEALLASINATMSTYDPNSELSKLNQNPSTTWIEISNSLNAVLQAARVVASDSDGAFDVTVGTLVNLWGFGPDRGAGTLPNPSALASARARVGNDKFELRAQPNAIRKQLPDLTIDLSGIAKGYSVDQLAHLLQSAGLKNFLVDIGGELRALGKNPKGQDWRIGIENPVHDGREIGRAIPLRGAGLASSGNYRNYFESDGIRYGHTIDPKTGAPVQHDLAGVTVIHSTAMLADAWATALMSLGYTAGREVANAQALAVLFIVGEADEWKSYTTPAFDLVVGNN
jgi:thiamine biosynthesis lipoprotein